MENEAYKGPLDDELLDQVGGGANQNVAMCDCPFCGKWIRPYRQPNGKLFCPVCTMQVGGPR